MHRPLALLLLAAPLLAPAEDFSVDPGVGNNSLSAVFDAALGERINAVSSAVGCEVSLDAGTGLASGRCSVPLTSIQVDGDRTKSEHFHDWATNRRSEPGDCRIEAVFAGVKLGELAPGKAAPFTAEIPFTVCGRARADGGREPVTGTAVLFPPGAYGEKKTVRIRATVAAFDREAYRVGPGFTEGWLARVQKLAKVVAAKGTIELSLFAKSKQPSRSSQTQSNQPQEEEP